MKKILSLDKKHFFLRDWAILKGISHKKPKIGATRVNFYLDISVCQKNGLILCVQW
jgi:hypothetical protein